MKTFKQHLQESKLSTIKSLKPTSKFLVFHGSTEKDIYEFCVKGVDATKRVSRHYNQQSSQGENGLFVTVDFSVAKRFGIVVMKFKVLGKQLRYTVPSREEEEREYFINKYPKSYKPEITGELLDSGEPQSLFVGTLSPRAIEKIYVQSYQSSDIITMTREQFIDYYEIKNSKKSRRPLFEPQEKPSLNDFLRRAGDHFNKEPKEILNIIKLQDIDDPVTFSGMFGDVFEPSVSQHILKQL